MVQTKKVYRMDHYVVRTNILNVKDKYLASLGFPIPEDRKLAAPIASLRDPHEPRAFGASHSGLLASGRIQRHKEVPLAKSLERFFTKAEVH